LRIGFAVTAGVLLLGIIGWPLVTPAEPFLPVFAGNAGFGGAILVLILAVVVGFVGFFVSWPYGREIAPLSVPFGLAIWAGRSGSVANMIQLNPGVQQRQALFATFKWEPLFWLLVIGAGFLGIYLAERLTTRSTERNDDAKETDSSFNKYLYSTAGLIASALIAWFLLGILAKGIRFGDNKLGAVLGQPDVAQIIFAVSVSFGAAAFAAKALLNTGYVFTIISAAAVSAGGVFAYANPATLEYMGSHWPGVFFPHPNLAILPIQMTAFAALGAIAGYWLGIRYLYWRKNGQ